MLLPPASELSAFDVLVLIPHSMLHGLPFHAVWPENGSGPLGTVCGISYAPSATIAAKCASRNPARIATTGGGWEFPVKGTEGQPRGAPKAPRRCFAVAADAIHGDDTRYGQLAETIASIFPDRLVWVGGRDGLKTYLYGDKRDEIEVLCVVCHGHYSETPGRTGLLFTPPKGYPARTLALPGLGNFHFADLPFDYFPPHIVTRGDVAGDIITIDELRVDCRTNADLVALVGCSTAAGTLVAGDNFRSMATQWLNMGAASVLASLWTVDLDFAASFVPRFLEMWRVRRQPKAIAFREALRQQVSSASVRITDWAVFALFGDWV